MSDSRPKTQVERAREKGVSRQRMWQMDKAAAGKCVICGRDNDGLSAKTSFCKMHRRKNRKRVREAQGYKPWKPGSSGRPPLEALNGTGMRQPKVQGHICPPNEDSEVLQ